MELLEYAIIGNKNNGNLLILNINHMKKSLLILISCLITAIAFSQTNITINTGTSDTAQYAKKIPMSSPTVLGGVKVGTGLSIDGSGILSVSSGSYAFTPPLVNTSGTVSLTTDASPTSSSTNPVQSGGVFTSLSGKQATLVSGTNIKTINGNSLLGSGDLTIAGGSSYTFANSLQNISGTVNLVGDNTNPGNSYYYGTNSGGNKGFYAFPTATAANLGMVKVGSTLLISSGTLDVKIPSVWAPITGGINYMNKVGIGTATVSGEFAIFGATQITGATNITGATEIDGVISNIYTTVNYPFIISNSKDGGGGLSISAGVAGGDQNSNYIAFQGSGDTNPLAAVFRQYIDVF